MQSELFRRFIHVAISYLEGPKLMHEFFPNIDGIILYLGSIKMVLARHFIQRMLCVGKCAVGYLKHFIQRCNVGNAVIGTRGCTG